MLIDLSSYTKCIPIEWFNSNSFYLMWIIWLELCESATTDVNSTYGNHSINLDSAHWPMGFKMLRLLSSYESWRNAKSNTDLQCILIIPNQDMNKKKHLTKTKLFLNMHVDVFLCNFASNFGIYIFVISVFFNTSQWWGYMYKLAHSESLTNHYN